MSTLRYAPQVISDAISELNNRQNSINSLTSQVADLTSQVNTLTGQVNTLTGDLDNVYNVIVDNTVGVVVVKENIDQYSVYCQNIITAYDNLVADKDATISTKNTLISTYEGYFSDICNNIKSMDGTVDDPIVFSKVADYVLTIPQSGSPTAYIQYLNDIYTVISANNQGITVTSGDYQNFDTNIQDIFNSYDAVITGKNNTIYSLTSTINEHEMAFGSIYTAIVNKGGTCTENDYSTYASGVNSIPTSGGGDTSVLEGYLDDIYDVISKNDVGVTVVAGDYGNFDDNTSAIISALKSQISTLQNQLSTANQTITTYQGYFADIASVITGMGGTVTDASSYSDYDSYVQTIPSGGTPVVQHGTLDWFKLPQNRNLTGMDFREVKSGKGSIVVFPENSSYLFANLGVPEYNSDGTQNEDYYDFRFYADKFDMSACTNIEGVFSNSCLDTFLPLTSNFCKTVQGDVTLDLTTFNTVDFDNFKNSIEKNTTGFKREFLLKHEHYESNVNYGGVRTLRNKGYTVTDANPEGE